MYELYTGNELVLTSNNFNLIEKQFNEMHLDKALIIYNSKHKIIIKAYGKINELQEILSTILKKKGKS